MSEFFGIEEPIALIFSMSSTLAGNGKQVQVDVMPGVGLSYIYLQTGAQVMKSFAFVGAVSLEIQEYGVMGRP